MTVFDRAGRKNTSKTLEIAYNFALEKGIKDIVVASTYGDTGLKALEIFDLSRINLIVITHNYGFKEPSKIEMLNETRQQLERAGATVYTGTMPFRSIGTAIRQLQGYSQQDLVANTLRLLGQGLKVCVEIAMMASDAGLVDTEDIVTIAGTGRGADTACVIKPVPSNSMFDLRVRQIIVKPYDW